MAKPKLLYLEDEGFLRNQTENFLTEDGYEVKAFGRIDLATKYLKLHADEIDCIITDLNMNDEWLGEYQVESNGCLLAGWVWLHRIVHCTENNLVKPCIIYSGYIQELKNHLEQYDLIGKLDEYNVSCVQKGGNDDTGYEALLDKLRAIIN